MIENKEKALELLQDLYPDLKKESVPQLFVELAISAIQTDGVKTSKDLAIFFLSYCE